MSRSRTQTAAMAAASVALLAALAGCNGSSEAAPPVVSTSTSPAATTSATPSATPIPSPTAVRTPEEQAVAQAEVVLHNYYDTMNALGLDPSADTAVLKGLAIGPGLLDAQKQIGLQREKGYRQIGEMKLTSVTPTLVDLRYDPKEKPAPRIPTVRFDVCYDVSGVNVVDATGKSVITPQRKEHALAVPGIVNYSWPDPKGWKVGYETVKGDPCPAP